MADTHSTSIPKGSLVLVTGANGFIATHIVKEFLDRGYRVRGTVRDISKSAFLIEDVFPAYAKRGDFELIAVPDLGVPNAFDEAVRGNSVAAIVHVASPLTFDPNPNNTIPQVVAGAIGLLHAAARESSVKKFVYTSSAPVAIAAAPGEVVHVTNDRWNLATIKAAWAPPPYEPARGGATYLAGKTEAEMAIWKFVDEEKPWFDVNSVLPYATLGKGLNKYHLKGSAAWVRNLYDGQPGMMSTMQEMCYVNVRDVAMIHVAAVLDPNIKGERLFCWSKPITPNDILAILRQMHPSHQFMDDLPNKERALITKDDSPILSLLKKWAGREDWISLEETVRDGMEEVV